MLRTMLLLVGGLGIGLVLSWAWQGEPPPGGSVAAPVEPAAAPSGTARGADGARLAALEAALGEERERRAALEARVGELAAALESLERPAAAPRAGALPGDVPQPPNAAELRERLARVGPPGSADAQRRQIERLIEAGFAPDRAEWINRRTQELRMEALQAQYDARREGRGLDPGTALAGERALRGELGDADYERYLTALNRPTSATVAEVLASSPAERAGLKPGDQVVAYGGTRVFDMRDLNALTLEGAAGESVVVDVRRDGQMVQIVMPRGPLGVTVGDFPRGRGR